MPRPVEKQSSCRMRSSSASEHAPSKGTARRGASCRSRLARIRRAEQHQQTLVNWLNPPDQSALETTIGFEQVAIELTAFLAQHEPDPYLKQVMDFGLLEDFDHMYRY